MRETWSEVARYVIALGAALYASPALEGALQEQEKAPVEGEISLTAPLEVVGVVLAPSAPVDAGTSGISTTQRVVPGGVSEPSVTPTHATSSIDAVSQLAAGGR
jgi:hypothetical protein